MINNSLSRIDKSLDNRLLADSYIFKHNDTIFRYGGYGFWSQRDFMIYFDEDFNNWGGEDIEMGYRVYNNGFYFIPVKGATALHQEPEGGESSLDREGGKSITHDLLVDKCPAAHYRKQSPRELYSVPKVSIYIPAYNAEKNKFNEVKQKSNAKRSDKVEHSDSKRDRQHP